MAAQKFEGLLGDDKLVHSDESALVFDRDGIRYFVDTSLPLSEQMMIDAASVDWTSTR